MCVHMYKQTCAILLANHHIMEKGQRNHSVPWKLKLEVLLTVNVMFYHHLQLLEPTDKVLGWGPLNWTYMCYPPAFIRSQIHFIKKNEYVQLINCLYFATFFTVDLLFILATIFFMVDTQPWKILVLANNYFLSVFFSSMSLKSMPVKSARFDQTRNLSQWPLYKFSHVCVWTTCIE